MNKSDIIKAAELSWFQKRRLVFIEDVLASPELLRREMLVEKFEISMVAASRDITLYRKLAPANIKYDMTAKGYVRTDNFTRLLPEFEDSRYQAAAELLKQVEVVEEQNEGFKGLFRLMEQSNSFTPDQWTEIYEMCADIGFDLNAAIPIPQSTTQTNEGDR